MVRRRHLEGCELKALMDKMATEATADRRSGKELVLGPDAKPGRARCTCKELEKSKAAKANKWPLPKAAIQRVEDIYDITKEIETDRVTVEDEMLEVAVLILREQAHLLHFLGFQDCSNVIDHYAERVAETGWVSRFHFGMVLERMRK